MIKSNYNYWASYRRQMLDLLQEKYQDLYKGVVLDIGGRDRGNFKKPKDKVEKWIFADINHDYNPDIILDVSDMKQINSNSIDVVNAIELFEHVYKIEKGLQECFRVLKKNGIFILSIPFLFHIHADPNDFQRWTSTKWRIELEKIGFKVEKLIIMGKFYTTLAEMCKSKLKSIKKRYFLGKILFPIILPFLNLLIKWDNKSFVKEDPILNYYHAGYFIIARK